MSADGDGQGIFPLIIRQRFGIVARSQSATYSDGVGVCSWIALLVEIHSLFTYS